MNVKKLLVANRGEIAVRVHRTAAELGIKTVAIFPEDDKASMHAQIMDEQFQLEGTGAAAYLHIEQVLNAAKESNCQAIHPGYGFLAESAEFAQACAKENLIFVGPSPESLTLFGDKLSARKLADEHAYLSCLQQAH